MGIEVFIANTTYMFAIIQLLTALYVAFLVGCPRASHLTLSVHLSKGRMLGEKSDISIATIHTMSWNTAVCEVYKAFIYSMHIVLIHCLVYRRHTNIQ